RPSGPPPPVAVRRDPPDATPRVVPPGPAPRGNTSCVTSRNVSAATSVPTTTPMTAGYSHGRDPVSPRCMVVCSDLIGQGLAGAVVAVGAVAAVETAGRTPVPA